MRNSERWLCWEEGRKLERVQDEEARASVKRQRRLLSGCLQRRGSGVGWGTQERGQGWKGAVVGGGALPGAQSGTQSPAEAMHCEWYLDWIGKKGREGEREEGLKEKERPGD